MSNAPHVGEPFIDATQPPLQGVGPYGLEMFHLLLALVHFVRRGANWQQLGASQVGAELLARPQEGGLPGSEFIHATSL